MLRFLASFLVLASPAAAWEATLGPICTLDHETSTASVSLTYDPSAPLYTITVTLLNGTWSDYPVFELRFFGGNPLAIQSDRHILSADRKSLTVTDQGFGNVLNGLQYNDNAVAILGRDSELFPLTGAAPHVQAFRDCPPSAGV